MTDEELIAYFTSVGYENVRKLPDGNFAGTVRLMFTTGLCIDLNGMGHNTRFCFTEKADALRALAELKTVDDVPTGWIARRPEL